MKLASCAGAAGLWLLAGIAALPAASAWAAPPAAAGSFAAFSEDQRAADDAMATIGRGGYAAFGPHEAALRRALDRAPTLDQARAMVGGDEARAKGVLHAYGRIALLLGGYANEKGDFKAAEAYLDRGLAIDPTNSFLTSEKGAALVSQHRWDEALAVYTGGMSLPDLAPTDQARLLRGQGFALTELKRYDEAEAAYKKSLEFEPGHGGALHELQYIAGLRKGAAAEQGGLVVGTEAKKPQD